MLLIFEKNVFFKSIIENNPVVLFSDGLSYYLETTIILLGLSFSIITKLFAGSVSSIFVLDSNSFGYYLYC